MSFETTLDNFDVTVTPYSSEHTLVPHRQESTATLENQTGTWPEHTEHTQFPIELDSTTKLDGTTNPESTTSSTKLDSTTKWGKHTETWQVASASLSTPMLIAVAGAVLVLVIIIVVIICICRRKRQKISDDKMVREIVISMPWTENGARPSSAAARDSGFREEEGDRNADIELQPRFSMSLDSAGNTNTIDSGLTVANKVEANTRNSGEKDNMTRETVVFDSDSKVFKVKAALQKTVVENEEEASGREEGVASGSNNEMDGSGEEPVTIRKHQHGPKTFPNYEYAYPVNAPGINLEYTRNERDENDVEDPYMTMGQVSESNYMNATVSGLEKEDMYANSVQIQRYQSLVETGNQTHEHFPKRSASEIIKGSAKPPKPQPRLSKKRELDPYDYLPRFSKGRYVKSPSS